MPKYVYFCEECKEDFEIKHSFQKTCSMCEICGNEDSLVRRPSSVFLTKKHGELAGISEAGKVIKATIEETREDIASEKQRLQNRVYNKQ